MTIIVFHVVVTAQNLLDGHDIIKKTGATPICFTIIDRRADKYKEDIGSDVNVKSLFPWDSFDESRHRNDLPLDESVLLKQESYLLSQGIIRKSIKELEKDSRDREIRKSQLDVFMEENEEAIDEIIKKFEILGKSKYTIKKWLSQFETEDGMIIALKLLKNLIFYDKNMIQMGYNNLHKQLKNNGIKSEDSIFLDTDWGSETGKYLLNLYEKGLENEEIINIRTAGDLLFDDPSEFSQKKLVFISDFIGINAKKTLKFFDQFFERPKKMEEMGIIDIQLRQNLDRKIAEMQKFFIVIAGFENGIERLKEKYDFEILIMDILNKNHKAFSQERNIFDGLKNTNKAKELIAKIGRNLYPDGPLGFEKNEALIVFHHYVPPNTLPIFWSTGNPDNKWEPLFG